MIILINPNITRSTLPLLLSLVWSIFLATEMMLQSNAQNQPGPINSLNDRNVVQMDGDDYLTFNKPLIQSVPSYGL